MSLGGASIVTSLMEMTGLDLMTPPSDDSPSPSKQSENLFHKDGSYSDRNKRSRDFVSAAVAGKSPYMMRATDAKPPDGVASAGVWKEPYIKRQGARHTGLCNRLRQEEVQLREVRH